MSDKSTILNDILNSIDEKEETVLEKVATDAGGLKNTENKEAVKTLPVETPSKKESKLGLSSLRKNTFQEEVLDFRHVSANKQDKQGTENISAKKIPIEAGVTFEKKASADIIASIYEYSGVDLDKVASEEVSNEMLVKVAMDTMEELKDLEKIAETLAESTATRFLDIIKKEI